MNRGLAVKNQGKPAPPNQPKSADQQKKKPCYRCLSDQHDQNACPHKDNKCGTCGKNCMGKREEKKAEQARQVNQEPSGDPTPPPRENLPPPPNVVNQVSRPAGADYWGPVRQTPRCQIFYKHTPVHGTRKSAVYFTHMSLPDTGATRTIISLDILQRLSLIHI